MAVPPLRDATIATPLRILHHSSYSVYGHEARLAFRISRQERIDVALPLIVDQAHFRTGDPSAVEAFMDASK
jgi:putative ubiquitin-RnfH superfamily antitoxin RatB of RatAB toxin-antitoxin module